MANKKLTALISLAVSDKDECQDDSQDECQCEWRWQGVDRQPDWQTDTDGLTITRWQSASWRGNRSMNGQRQKPGLAHWLDERRFLVRMRVYVRAVVVTSAERLKVPMLVPQECRSIRTTSSSICAICSTTSNQKQAPESPAVDSQTSNQGGNSACK